MRNIIENSYFGIYFGSVYGTFPAKFATVVGVPILLVMPKLLNVIAGIVVLTLLFLVWWWRREVGWNLP